MTRWAVAALYAAAVSACGEVDPADQAVDEPPPPPREILSVEQAIAADTDATVRVRGGLYVVDDHAIRLCSAWMESYPPQCGGASLVVDGLDLDDVTFTHAEGDVRWVDDVELRGVVENGTFAVQD